MQIKIHALENNTILSCFLSFSSLLTYTFYFLQLSQKFFKATAELAIHIGIPTNELKVEIETQLVIAETQIKECSM